VKQVSCFTIFSPLKPSNSSKEVTGTRLDDLCSVVLEEFVRIYSVVVEGSIKLPIERRCVSVG
jgi:hypothetical protein